MGHTRCWLHMENWPLQPVKRSLKVPRQLCSQHTTHKGQPNPVGLGSIPVIWLVWKSLDRKSCTIRLSHSSQPGLFYIKSPCLSHLRTVVTLRFTVMQEVGPGPYHRTYYPHPTGLTTVDISRSNKCISIFELTVPYERNISKYHNYKSHKYAS